MNIIDSDLLSIQEARILAENACEAQKELATFSQEKLDAIVEAIADAISGYVKELAVMSSEETYYGKWQDKCVKNKFVCEYVRREIRGMKCVGIINEDKEKRMMDIGVPVGVIAALCPATSPVSTTIYNTLIGIKAGDAIVFAPHPRAKNTIGKALDIIIEAAEKNGLPEGALSYLHTVTVCGTVELMRHEDVSLIMNTGVPGMLKKAQDSGKPLIYGGAGNGPVFIERTADIQQAVKDIVASKSFDNGILPAAEQSIVVDQCIAIQVREEFIRNNTYFMTNKESKYLAGFFYNSDGSANTELIGISAEKIAEIVGFSVPKGTKLLASEEKFASQENPYAREKLGPIVAYFIEDDWVHACEKCIELLITEKHGHTLVIHSSDEEVIRQFALKKPVGRVLVNTAATFGSIGATTNLFPAMTLGSGSTGRGITSDNVSPMNLIYIRKVGYGVKKIESLDFSIVNDINLSKKNITQNKNNNSENLHVLNQILQGAIEEIDKMQD